MRRVIFRGLTLAEADRLFSQGRYQEAETKYYEAQKALLWTSEKCKADMGLAKTNLKLGNRQSALFWFMSANEGGCPEGRDEARKLRESMPPTKPPERPVPPSIPNEPAWDYSQMIKALNMARGLACMSRDFSRQAAAEGLDPQSP